MENINALKVLAVIVLLVASNFISWQVGRNGSLWNSNKTNVTGATMPSAVPIPGGTRSIGGTVENVSDSGFIITTSTSNPYFSGGPSVRNVLVNKETVIERLIQKDPATIQAEQAVFMVEMQKLQESKTAPTTVATITPPEPFTREEISLKDLKTGDAVFVSASEDISTTEQFTAVRVALQS